MEVYTALPGMCLHQRVGGMEVIEGLHDYYLTGADDFLLDSDVNRGPKRRAF